MPRWPGVWLLLAGVSTCAGEANLVLRLPPNETLYYQWTIDTTTESKGSELGKPFETSDIRGIRLLLVLRGRKPPVDGESEAVVRFENLAIEEDRKVGLASHSQLKVSKNSIVQIENGKTVVDSNSDIGLDRITDYQRNLRGLEAGEVVLGLDAAGRRTRTEGDKALVDTLHAGQSQALFPLLAGKRAAAGESWDDRFEIPRLGELALDSPAVVRARMTFAKWEQRDGKKLALVDVISAWESRDLRGKDSAGLSAEISELEGLGSGVCYFDPEAGRFTEGLMTLQLKYKLAAKKDQETTSLAVQGKTRFTFKLVPPPAAGPQAPKK